MKLLLACVNSLVSLIGYDTETQQSFWYLPANVLPVCGLCYHGDALVLGSDNAIVEVAPGGVKERILPGPHDNLVHSVHSVGERIGVVDTGNSVLLFKSPETGRLERLDPLQGWEQRPEDAIHLNDFTPWKGGYLASCFHFGPFHHLKRHRALWKLGGYGLILFLQQIRDTTTAKVVASGLHCPHSLKPHAGRLYCCSSMEGSFIALEEDARGQLRESHRWDVTSEHFLRGALRHEHGWFLGGSTIRHRNTSSLALFDLHEESGAVTAMPVANAGEVYEILPWDDAIMRPLTATLNALPATIEDDNVYPQKVNLPRF